jgi:hypothetical protein
MKVLDFCGTNGMVKLYLDGIVQLLHFRKNKQYTVSSVPRISIMARRLFPTLKPVSAAPRNIARFSVG